MSNNTSNERLRSFMWILFIFMGLILIDILIIVLNPTLFQNIQGYINKFSPLRIPLAILVATIVFFIHFFSEKSQKLFKDYILTERFLSATILGFTFFILFFFVTTRLLGPFDKTATLILFSVLAMIISLSTILSSLNRNP